MRITRKSDIQSVASIVCDCLLKHQISAVLVGDAVVSIYTHGEYESKEIGFVTSADIKSIEKALKEIGFKKSAERCFEHPDTRLLVKFPPPPLAVGNVLIKEWATQHGKSGTLQMLTPTHSVMGRLANYFDQDDEKSLDEAVAVAKRQPIRTKDLERWANSLGELEKFEVFTERLTGHHD